MKRERFPSSTGVYHIGAERETNTLVLWHDFPFDDAFWDERVDELEEEIRWTVEVRQRLRQTANGRFYRSIFHENTEYSEDFTCSKLTESSYLLSRFFYSASVQP